MWHLTDMPMKLPHVRFSNRPFGVKHFQTIHQCGVDVARGLALLFGIGTKAFPSWDSRTWRNNLYRGLTVRQTAGPSGHANFTAALPSDKRQVQADMRTHLIHRPARDIL